MIVGYFGMCLRSMSAMQCIVKILYTKKEDLMECALRHFELYFAAPPGADKSKDLADFSTLSNLLKGLQVSRRYALAFQDLIIAVSFTYMKRT